MFRFFYNITFDSPTRRHWVSLEQVNGMKTTTTTDRTVIKGALGCSLLDVE